VVVQPSRHLASTHVVVPTQQTSCFNTRGGSTQQTSCFNTRGGSTHLPTVQRLSLLVATLSSAVCSYMQDLYETFQPSEMIFFINVSLKLIIQLSPQRTVYAYQATRPQPVVLVGQNTDFTDQPSNASP